jgi:hypothetical protein
MAINGLNLERYCKRNKITAKSITREVYGTVEDLEEESRRPVVKKKEDKPRSPRGRKRTVTARK